MKTAKVTPLSTVLAVSFGLALGLAPTLVEAHCKGKHADYAPHCDGGGGNGGATDKYVLNAFLDDVETGCDCCNDGADLYANGGGVTAGGDKFRVGLNLGFGSGRSFFLNFSNRVSGSGGEAGLPWPTLGYGETTGMANVFSTGEAESLRDMGINEQNRPRMVEITFHDGTPDSWSLIFDHERCEGTTEIPVSRNGNTWNFVSNDETACLLRKKGGHGKAVFHGNYKMTFDLEFMLVP